jgi:3-deoxy-D-manno-octulosonate 8-phosphate phosphatase (KDO 8-P phosphatase)
MKTRKDLARRIKKIKMVLLDVDGVLTDGGIYYSADGVEMKRFNAQDGYGVARAREHGLKIGIISGRSTPVVETRAREMHADEVIQGSPDKLAAMTEIGKRHGLAPEQMAFIGDDLFDLPLLNAVGFSAAPENARPEVKKAVHYVTPSSGGHGAVRELIEFILKHLSA